MENVVPEMNIQWFTYIDFWFHEGCFRYHNEALKTDCGAVISQDCNLCHNILANK